MPACAGCATHPCCCWICNKCGATGYGYHVCRDATAPMPTFDASDVATEPAPVVSRAPTGEMERLAAAAGVQQRVAEEARDRAEELLRVERIAHVEMTAAFIEGKLARDRGESDRAHLRGNIAALRADVAVLHGALGDVLRLLDSKEFRSAEDQEVLRCARAVHGCWTVKEERAGEDRREVDRRADPSSSK